MKRRTGVFTIFLLIIILTACGNETKNASNQAVANLDNVKKIISKTGQKEAEITSDVDKKNIIFLLKSLSNPVDAYFQSSSKLILTVDSQEIDVDLSEMYIKIDKKIYKNPSVSKQISSVCENYLYNINNYISSLNAVENIELSAKDWGKSIPLTQDAKSELINLLKMPSRHQSQDEPFFIPPDYPYYQVVSKDNSISPLTIYKNSIITVDSKQMEVYFINAQLYEFCLKYLPLYEGDLTGLKELFLSDTLKLKPSEDGAVYKSKMFPIIRVLNEATLTNNDKSIISEDKVNLTFYQGEIVRKVTVYKDGFLYKNSYYKLENLKDIVINTLNAN